MARLWVSNTHPRRPPNFRKGIQRTPKSGIEQRSRKIRVTSSKIKKYMLVNRPLTFQLK
jgi:hypothetical protein